VTTRASSFLAWPARVAPGRFTAVPVVTSDYFPTILDVLDVRVSDPVEPLDGISIRDVIEGSGATLDARPIGFESHGMIAVVHDRWKLLFPGRPPLELYDLEADAGEQRDVAASNPDLVLELARWLDGWRRSARGADHGAVAPAAPWRGVDPELSLEGLALRQRTAR
jgi:arylsulfatase A-like enzyme